MGQQEGASPPGCCGRYRGGLTFLADVGLELPHPGPALGHALRRGGAAGAPGDPDRLPLVGVLYILDEPSVGLHQRDHGRLLETLIELRDMGNTVLVVEHDEETIARGGLRGGHGARRGHRGARWWPRARVEQMQAHPKSLTGLYLSGQAAIPVPKKRRSLAPAPHAQGRAARTTSRESTCELPLGVLTCVTGVSGSGKSTLVIDTLLPALRGPLHGAKDQPGDHDGVDGDHGLIDKVISIDQSPIGRTPRSNPATYTGVFTPYPRALRRPPGEQGARLQGRALLLQRQGRALRGLPGRRHPAHRDALFARCLRDLRGLRRPPLRPGDPRGACTRGTASPTCWR